MEDVQYEFHCTTICMRVKILYDDSGNNPMLGVRPHGWIPRWKVGEIGELLENDFPQKYDYKVKLSGTDHIDDLFGHGPIDAARIYYFCKGEVELLGD